jgi:hypothetical protein
MSLFDALWASAPPYAPGQSVDDLARQTSLMTSLRAARGIPYLPFPISSSLNFSSAWHLHADRDPDGDGCRSAEGTQFWAQYGIDPFALAKTYLPSHQQKEAA